MRPSRPGRFATGHLRMRRWRGLRERGRRLRRRAEPLPVPHPEVRARSASLEGRNHGKSRSTLSSVRRAAALSLLEDPRRPEIVRRGEGGRRLLVRGRGGHDHRADRAERRRQDHHVQHDQRPAPGRFRRDPLRGRKHRAATSRTASPARASAAPFRSAASSAT